MSAVRFYSVGDEYGVFSNFALYPIKLDGETWPTTEHYFQAQKFADAAYRAHLTEVLARRAVALATGPTPGVVVLSHSSPWA